MKSKAPTILTASLAILVFICLSACAPRPSAATLVGSWKTESGGAAWQWSFSQGGDFAWKILGQTDMGGKPLEIGGAGRYALSAATLSLSFDKFPGVPGVLRSGDAAPGFDAKTEVKLRFAGASKMLWAFDSAALGPQESSLARIE